MSYPSRRALGISNWLRMRGVDRTCVADDWVGNPLLDMYNQEVNRRIDRATIGAEIYAPPPRRKVYLAGPITGYDPQERIETFRKRAALLEEVGFEVVNPCELSPPGKDWNKALRTDIKAMMDCDTIYLQRGWEKSNGVRLELPICLALKFDVMVEGDDI